MPNVTFVTNRGSSVRDGVKHNKPLGYNWINNTL